MKRKLVLVFLLCAVFLGITGVLTSVFTNTEWGREIPLDGGYVNECDDPWGLLTDEISDDCSDYVEPTSYVWEKLDDEPMENMKETYQTKNVFDPKATVLVFVGFAILVLVVSIVREKK